MNMSVRKALAVSICAALLAPLAATACAIVTPEQRAEYRRKAVDKAKEDVLALRDRSDLVFMGRLKRLDFHEETRNMGPGKRPQVLQVHEAVFESISNIKGEYAPEQALSFTTVKNQVTIGCGAVFMDSLPQENGAGERYLVYARDGVILRTNHVPHKPQVLSAYEEAQLMYDTK